MNQVLATPGRPGQGFAWPFLSSLLSRFMLLLAWILTWTIIFSAVDFWSIKLYDVCNSSWFQDYRAAMRYGASWVSPASFALAENAYFVWMNVYDRDYRMHEWDWYSGNPVNPDGNYNFVWGDGNGGWVRFPMKEWYGAWSVPTGLWLVLLTFISKRKQAITRKNGEALPARLIFWGLADALKWPLRRLARRTVQVD